MFVLNASSYVWRITRIGADLKFTTTRALGKDATYLQAFLPWTEVPAE
jgi:hypothetical protein